MNRGDGETDRRQRFGRLCESLRPDLLRFAWWLGRDRGLAEDVVQESLLRAWKSFDSLEDEGKATVLAAHDRAPRACAQLREEAARTRRRRRARRRRIGRARGARGRARGGDAQRHLPARGRIPRAAGAAGAAGLLDAGNRGPHGHAAGRGADAAVPRARAAAPAARASRRSASHDELPRVPPPRRAPSHSLRMRTIEAHRRECAACARHQDELRAMDGVIRARSPSTRRRARSGAGRGGGRRRDAGACLRSRRASSRASPSASCCWSAPRAPRSRAKSIGHVAHEPGAMTGDGAARAGRARRSARPGRHAAASRHRRRHLRRALRVRRPRRPAPRRAHAARVRSPC